MTFHNEWYIMRFLCGYNATVYTGWNLKKITYICGSHVAVVCRIIVIPSNNQSSVAETSYVTKGIISTL